LDLVFAAKNPVKFSTQKTTVAVTQDKSVIVVDDSKAAEV
jgi:hypothetical protein